MNKRDLIYARVGRGETFNFSAFPIYEHLLSFVKGKSALDLGSGSGIWVNKLQDEGFSVTAVEGAPEKKEALVKKGIRIGEFDLDSYPYPFKSNSFDLISAIAVVEHLESPYKMLSECRRLLRGDGLLMVEFPDYRNFEQGKKFLDTERCSHTYAFDRKSAHYLVKRTGFLIQKDLSYGGRKFSKYLFLQPLFKNLLHTNVILLCKKNKHHNLYFTSHRFKNKYGS